MAITLKSPREIELMRKAGAVVADVLLKLQEIAEPGISTGELDQIALDMAAKARAKALFKGVESPYAKQPFPGAICASVNSELVHGIPSAKTRLNEGDIISIDFGVEIDGYCGDSAVTFGIGKISDERQLLLDVTRQTLEIAISEARPGVKWSTVAGKMQKYAESAGFSVVKEYVGHGIGREMHEDPKLPNYVSRELLMNDFVLAEGMVLAIEPMINAGSSGVRTLRDGWVVVTKDGKDSAHFEHTVAITKDGNKILTLK